MKRVLLDENMPRKLRRELPGCVVRTVQEEGWGSFENGALLRRAAANFDVFVTADRRMQFQQTLSGYEIGVVVIVTPRLWYAVLKTVGPELREAVASVRPGEIVHIHAGMP